MSFSADIAAFAQRAGESLDKTVRDVTIELGTAVMKDTPIDEGRAKGNWQTTTGAPATGVVERFGDGGAIAELYANAGGAGTITFITNNLPYIYRLELGWSSQRAPYAMVRGNFQRVQDMVTRAARDNRV